MTIISDTNSASRKRAAQAFAPARIGAYAVFIAAMAFAGAMVFGLIP